MGNRNRHAVCLAAVLAASVLTCQGAMAGEHAISIDMTDHNDAAWSGIAMANDDTVTTGVNIRTAPDREAAVAGFLYRGGAVYVLTQGDDWTEVTSGNVTGYIRNEYLVYGADAKGLAEHYGIYGVQTTWNDVNMFAENSGSSRIVKSAQSGETYRLAGKSGAWMELTSENGRSFYVPAEDVSPVIVLDGAVSLDDSEGSYQAERAFDVVGDAPAAEGEVYEEASYNEDTEASETYTESYDETWTETNDQSTYSETGYSEPVYEEPAYEEPVYEAPAQSTADYSYSTSYDGSGSLQEQANALYEDYLNAQAQADAAVADGAGSDTIIATAQAAQDAYARFLQMQNAADEASWNNGSSAAAETTTVSQDNTYTDDTAETVTETPAEPTVSETTSPVSSSDVSLLAALIYCEAGNQPYEGQVAVGAVVMNRIASGSFPNTVSDVIYQGGQFTPAFSGALANAIANGSGANYLDAASEAMAGSDPTGGALYFNTHQGYGTKIGAHWFF